MSADKLSYLAADVEISRPGLLANSTSRNGPNGGTTCVPGGWQTHVPCTGPRESNCRVPDVPQPWAFATGISHYAAYYVLESSHSLGCPPCGNAVRSGGLRIGFGSRILQLPWDHPRCAITAAITSWSLLLVLDRDRKRPSSILMTQPANGPIC